MSEYKELDAAFRHIISECGEDGKVWFDKRFICEYVSHLKYTIEQLVKERDAAVADLEKCMHYAKPKNNNVCNFCKKDMSKYPDKCDGWSDFCECEPKWRGVQEEENDNE